MRLFVELSSSFSIERPFTVVFRGQSLARLGAEVTGIDPSSENVAVASLHAQGDPLTRGIRYEAATAEHLDAQGKKEEAVCTAVATGVVLEEVRECGRCRGKNKTC